MVAFAAVFTGDTALVLATWDDHDYCGNNTDRSCDAKETVLRAFSDDWANPSFGLPTTPWGVLRDLLRRRGLPRDRRPLRPRERDRGRLDPRARAGDVALSSAASLDGDVSRDRLGLDVQPRRRRDVVALPRASATVRRDPQRQHRRRRVSRGRHPSQSLSMDPPRTTTSPSSCPRASPCTKRERALAPTRSSPTRPRSRARKRRRRSCSSTSIRRRWTRRSSRASSMAQAARCTRGPFVARSCGEQRDRLNAIRANSSFAELVEGLFAQAVSRASSACTSATLLGTLAPSIRRMASHARATSRAAGMGPVTASV
jgi:hypothetical protein